MDLDVLSATSLLEHWQIRMSGARRAVLDSREPAFRGLITLRAYSMREEMAQNNWYVTGRGATRGVLYPDDHSLRAHVNGLAASYAPGAPVNAELELRNASQWPGGGRVWRGGV